MTITLSRALPLIEVKGRTLEGVAYKYAHPSSVTDDGEEFYYEQILRGADTKTIRDRAARGDSFPVLIWHSRTVNKGQLPPDSIGDVQFHPNDTELEFKAVLNRSRLADEMLELVDDEVARDTSVSFSPRRDIEGVHEGRLLLSRAEISLRELSLAPTGTGQHAGAKVLVMRATAAPDPEIDARLRLLNLF
jgi:HK97 family phage prohead protease